ncbi:hypothetical protein Taro_024663 [Colocasia esculenta]|uniref:BHLH domain-containing protein n=1 Tax=Colocasia esculenta TaxID=4460 RepID=A0A843V0Y6_COLES|nr:hypothetical protein [Colocasia esculenta]
MQPTSREMQGMPPSMPSMQPPQQQQQQIQGAGLQQFDDTGASSHDDFFDQVLSSLPWADLNHGNAKSPWDLPGGQKLEQAMGEEGLRYTAGPYDESALLASRLRQHQISAGAGGKPMVLQINHQAAQQQQQQQQHMLLSAMGRSAVGGDSGLLPLPLSPGSVDSADSRLLVDRSRNDADPPFKSPTSSGGDGLYNGFAGSLQEAAQAAAAANAQHFHIPQGGALPTQNFGAATAVGMGQTAAASGAAGGGAAPPRQRVRARRGQATDPHSIAERLRRERIAERMKALQELVPNANKTDKASMLDEIIDYVKFLQLQVLSMSRLGGAAAVAPLVADVPSEASGGRGGGGAGNQAAATAAAPGGGDNLTLAEHQVAKLMEEDMGAAMQYLQGKGLCLMPISLASAISTATCHSRPGIHAGGGNPAAMPHAPAANGDAPTSPNMSVLTGQSAMANGDGDAARPSAKDLLMWHNFNDDVTKLFLLELLVKLCPARLSSSRTGFGPGRPVSRIRTIKENKEKNRCQRHHNL